MARHKLVSVGACPFGPHIAVTSGVKLCVSNLAMLCSRFYGVTHVCVSHPLPTNVIEQEGCIEGSVLPEGSAI